MHSSKNYLHVGSKLVDPTYQDEYNSKLISSIERRAKEYQDYMEKALDKGVKR